MKARHSEPLSQLSSHHHCRRSCTRWTDPRSHRAGLINSAHSRRQAGEALRPDLFLPGHHSPISVELAAVCWLTGRLDGAECIKMTERERRQLNQFMAQPRSSPASMGGKRDSSVNWPDDNGTSIHTHSTRHVSNLRWCLIQGK